MANPPRAKGTSFESEMLPLLREVWPAAERAGTTKGSADYGDYLNVDGWLVEAKKSNRPRFMEWIRTARAKVEHRSREVAPRIYHQTFVMDTPWMIVWAADRRTLPGAYALMPLEQALELIKSEGAA